MKTIANIQVEPIGGGTSIREQVGDAIEILGKSGMRVQVHALGTEIEGDFEQLMNALQKIHHDLHKSGAPRIFTSVTLETRIDKPVSLARSLG